MPDATDTRDIAGRIEALIEEFRGMPDPRAREKAEDLVRLLMEFYGAGLARILELSGEVERFTGDPLVSSLLLLHGLHPLDMETRIRRTLDRLPFDLEFLGLEEGVAKLRLARNGCASTAASVTGALEEALLEAAPELAGIEIEGGATRAVPLVQIAMPGQ